MLGEAPGTIVLSCLLVVLVALPGGPAGQEAPVVGAAEPREARRR